MQKKIVFFINPKSNEGKALTFWKKVHKHYPELPEHPVDITTISNLSEYIKKESPYIIAIAGGDGTVNAVCQAIVDLPKKPLLTILPLGFGNALSYCFGVETIQKAVDVLTKQPDTVTVDLMKTNIKNHPLGLFNISVGFDARIVYSRMNHRYIGFRSYILAALRSFVFHTEKEIVFTIDHAVTLRATASSLVIANSPIIGQNVVIANDAKLNDGLLDCTLFATKFDYLSNLRFRGFKHPFYSKLGKVRFKAKHIQITGEPFLQIDGDPMVQKEDTQIEIIPNKITFLRNTLENIDQRYSPFIL